METSSPVSSRPLREAITALLWKQWSALGVAGHVAPGGQAIVDPEALLLFSTVFARHDARLFDEMLDWLQQNGAWVSVLRLTRMQQEFELGDATILGAVAGHLVRDSSLASWRALTRRPPRAAQPRPLFDHLPTPGQSDEIFRQWGWQRPPLDRRGLSRPPKPNQPAAFLLKLRSLFGRQSRAEVFAWLLTHESGHPAQIARETGYFRGSVQNVLNDLEVSGHVFATREGREKHFFLPREDWRFLLTWTQDRAAAFPQWMPWAVLFTTIRRFHDLTSSPGFADHSTDLQAIELHRVLSPLLARLTTEGHRPPALAEPIEGRSAAQLLPSFQQLLAELSG